MHTFRHGGTVFHYNSDLSGLVVIVQLRPPVEFAVPGEALRAWADHVGQSRDLVDAILVTMHETDAGIASVLMRERRDEQPPLYVVVAEGEDAISNLKPVVDKLIGATEEGGEG